MGSILQAWVRPLLENVEHCGGRAWASSYTWIDYKLHAEIISWIASVYECCLTKYMRTFNFPEIFKSAFKVYGIWPEASIDTHTLPQSSPASVGLTQAHPNYKNAWCHFSCTLVVTKWLVAESEHDLLSFSGLVASWVFPRWCWLPWTVTHLLSSFYWTWAVTSMHRLIVASVQEW